MAIQISDLMSKENLQTVWGRINALFVRKEDGKGLSTNDFSNEYKTKVDGIDEGANKYIHPDHADAESQAGLYKVTVDALGHVTHTDAVGKADITALGIPAENTTYDTMTGAGTDTDGTGGLVPAPVAGNNTRFLRSDGTWVTPPDNDTTYNPATATEDGLFTSQDFTKLQGIAEGATRVIVDSAMDESSTNAIQTKVVKAYTDSAAAQALSSAKTYTDQKLVSVYRYKGSVATEDELPSADTEGLAAGDVYNIEAESSYGAAGMNVGWTGESWDNLGGSFSISTISDDDILAICQ